MCNRIRRDMNPAALIRGWFGEAAEGDLKPAFATRDDHRFDVPEILARNNFEYVQLARLLEEYAPDGADQCVDIGCAYGRFVPLLAEFSDTVVGVEPRDGVRRRAAELYPDANFAGAVASDIPLRDASADVAVVWKVIQHLEADEAEEALSEVQRILSTNGVFVLCEETSPNAGDDRGTFSRPADMYRRALDSLDLVALEPRSLGRGPTEYTTAEVMVFRGGCV